MKIVLDTKQLLGFRIGVGGEAGQKQGAKVGVKL